MFSDQHEVMNAVRDYRDKDLFKVSSVSYLIQHQFRFACIFGPSDMQSLWNFETVKRVTDED